MICKPHLPTLANINWEIFSCLVYKKFKLQLYTYQQYLFGVLYPITIILTETCKLQ